MGEEQGQVGTSVENDQKSPDELRREIEETRQDLGDTAAALAEKTDIKARAKVKLDDLKRTVADKRQSLAQSSDAGDGAPGAAAGQAATQAKAKARENPVATAALAAFAAGYVLGRITST